MYQRTLFIRKGTTVLFQILSYRLSEYRKEWEFILSPYLGKNVFLYIDNNWWCYFPSHSSQQKAIRALAAEAHSLKFDENGDLR